MNDKNNGLKQVMLAISVTGSIFYTFKGMWTPVIGNVIAIIITLWYFSRKKEDKK